MALRILILSLLLCIIKANFTNSSRSNTTYEFDDDEPNTVTIYTKYCETSSDCYYLNSCINNICNHDDFFPLKVRSVIGVGILLIALTFSTAVGMGGGGLILPTLILILNFYSHQAIPLSKAIVFVNTFISFLLHIYQRHPKKNSITIDYNLSLICIPALLHGSTVGVQLNHLVKGALLTLLLSISLVIIAIRIIIKTFYFTNRELTDESKEFVEEENQTKDDSVKSSQVSVAESVTSIPRKLEIEVKDDNDKFPVPKYILFLLPYSVFLIYIFITLSSYGRSIFDVNHCHITYWLFFCLFTLIMLTIIILSGRMLINQYKRRRSIGYSFITTDILWNKRHIFVFTFVSFIVGVISGSIGLGGGVILCPIFFEYGLNPIVAAHTSNFIVVFISSATVIQFYLLDLLVTDYLFIMGLLPIISAVVGVNLINQILKKSNKEYPVLVIMSIVLGVASFGMTFFSLTKVMRLDSISSLFELRDFCY